MKGRTNLTNNFIIYRKSGNKAHVSYGLYLILYYSLFFYTLNFILLQAYETMAGGFITAPLGVSAAF